MIHKEIKIFVCAGEQEITIRPDYENDAIKGDLVLIVNECGAPESEGKTVYMDKEEALALVRELNNYQNEFQGQTKIPNELSRRL